METQEILTRSMPLIAVILVWAIIAIAHRTLRHRQDAQKDIQLALLNKFSTGEEMARFLASEEGRRLIDQLATNPHRKNPLHVAVGIAMGGIINLALSLGFLTLTYLDGAFGGFIVPAVICGALALGMLAGAAMFYRLSPRSSEQPDR
jgi:hypothetical protein